MPVEITETLRAAVPKGTGGSDAYVAILSLICGYFVAAAACAVE